MKIASTFFTKLDSEYTTTKSNTCNLESTNTVNLFSFSSESIKGDEDGTVKKIKGIDGKKHEALEKTYTEVIDGFEWNVVEQTYIDKDENKFKITTKTTRLVKNYDGKDVEFTLTKKIQEVCDASSTSIEKITTDKEETKYIVRTITTIEKKEIVGPRTYTNTKKTESTEYLKDECKMPNGFSKDVLEY